MIHAKHAWLNFNYVPDEPNSLFFLFENGRKLSLLKKKKKTPLKCNVNRLVGFLSRATVVEAFFAILMRKTQVCAAL